MEWQIPAMLLPQARELLAELPVSTALEPCRLQAAEDGQLSGLRIKREGNRIEVAYSRPVYFFRALGLLCEEQGEAWERQETARFDSNGMMVDCSRNAVPSTGTIKRLIRHMALMGLDTLMLYTEDTYEVDGEPYFGYMRGRYTREELRELDTYAAGYGIELVPCIQTLAHLNAMLQWAPYGEVADIGDILLVDEPQTYALVEKMLASCREAFRSRRIHIGMDEAHLLGKGRYYDKHGDSSRYGLMCRHLEKVAALCRRYQFEPMMWSDMFFRPGNGGDYYGPNPVPAEVAAKIQPDVRLVYWDYYHDKQEDYDRMLKLHQQVSGQTVFAGGAWKWNGYLPLNRTSIKRTKAALEACAENGVRDVFTTTWGDNGADASLYSVLPALQAQAEFGFGGFLSEQRLAERLKTCTGAVLSDFGLLDISEDKGANAGFANGHKYMLFQDVLLGLLDKHVPEGTQARYAELQSALKSIVQKGGPYRCLFETAEALSGVLALKAELGRELKEAYDRRDTQELQALAQERLPRLIAGTERFRDCLERQWMTENKPFGFEVQDIRLGALIQRLKTAKKRVEDYVSGSIDRIEELEEKRLPFVPGAQGSQIYLNLWNRTVTASVL